MKIKWKIKYELNAKWVLKNMEKLYVVENIFMKLWKEVGLKNNKGAN